MESTKFNTILALSIIAILISVFTAMYTVSKTSEVTVEEIENDYDDSLILNRINELRDTVAETSIKLSDYLTRDAYFDFRVDEEGIDRDDLEDVEDDIDDIEDDIDDLQDEDNDLQNQINSIEQPDLSGIQDNADDIAVIISCATEFNDEEDDIEDFINCLINEE